ncbi:Planctomycete cytochrome C [Roseimaritima multifibrata]|uniref:Planctomycete cytochrome C n=1 Tax=Roseimaritima multifibrata TaxID=1930274 RepID=A0A517MMB8_9BACT|nr:PSD1 and planctomycete cytochrome C domain-containing protein [Roseimaritima multifibrata]QDS96024.1 Planctomycete cytochrome C [Roseimaritima multifibrata]
MRNFIDVTLLGLFAIGWGICVPSVRGAENAIDFNRDIRPILSDKCFFCHGPDAHERKADLRLDTAEGALADLGGYAAIVPGNLEESEFVLRILDQDDPMPPLDSHKSLKPSEIELLKRWIAEGGEYSEPWAYVPPERHPVPEVSDTDWPENWIDHFVLARLEAEGLQPAPDADPVTLIRRLYFDLTGLPPTPAQVDAFVNGERELTAIVDELLESPHFGERLAMYWLDLVRYADTVGYHGDQTHNISPYRDWVIAALNANMPFDQFTREQLAGDLLPNPSTAQKVASGYNRLLQTTHEGGLQLKEYDAIYNADRVRNVSAVWMGATVGCAQCHDHKYDPYTIQDHYALGAFFADIADRGFSGNTLPANRPPEISVYSLEQQQELARLKAEMALVIDEETQTQLESLESAQQKLLARIKAAKTKEAKDTLATEQKDLEQRISQLASQEKRDAFQKLRKQHRSLEKQGRQTMITVAEEPRVMRVLPRGNWQDETGDVVLPAVPGFLGRVTPTAGERANRLDLANWLVDPENGAGGLTARVFANRFWYLFFGTGISRSLADFGGQGEPPANPELLDQIAVSFYESGWDVKKLVRLIVTSHAWRQSSVASPELLERDPHNQLVARQSRYRLPAELIRDNALAVSGLLISEEGGESAKPYQPAGYYRHLNFPTRKYAAHENQNQWRRGLYVHWQRMFLHPMLKAMDAPSREECTAQRPRSNTPNAALVLLNDPTFLESARVLGARILIEGGESADSRIDFAYRVVLSRSPDEEERVVLKALLEATQAEYVSKPATADLLLQTGIAPIPDGLDKIELASWTAVSRALLNLNETVTRN